MKNNAKDRKAQQRQRDKAAGLVRLELRVKPEHKHEIISFSQTLKGNKMNTVQFSKVSHLFTSKEEANLLHPSATAWVSPDLQSRAFSMNNNGPVGWLKVVDD